MISRAVVLAMVALIDRPGAFAQQTHVIKTNPDGTFSPQVAYVKSGDTVRWEQLARTDSIIPAAGPETYPAICGARKAFNPADPNDFTGPMPFAPSGVFTLSPLAAGFIEATGSCPANARSVTQGDNGKVLCIGREYEATMDSTWQSEHVTGVFIRLLWSDVNPGPGVFDFTVLRREVEKAVKQGKLYSLGIKAGDEGTPDWIFSTNADNSARASGGGGVPRLHLQDAGSDAIDTACGTRMDLGDPTRLTYRQRYTAMLTETANFLKSRADWYRALAYIKVSGANLFTHENRLPHDCSMIASGGTQTTCICNPAVFSADGYRPSGLYAFYDEQIRLLRDLFPGKAISYALIQDGFPRINETGGYQTSSGSSSNGSALPGAFEQTQSVLDLGQRSAGTNFVVQHNGLQPKAAGCPFDGAHPKPLRPLDDYQGGLGSRCPNRWVVREGAEGQITGWQTSNKSEVGDPSELNLAFQNAWDNSDGVFLEVYEDRLWEAANRNRGVLPGSGKTVGGWAEDFHKRRTDPAFPVYVAAKNPFPAVYSRVFNKTTPGSEAQYLYYIHGMKCGLGKQEWGLIVIDAQPPSIKAGGVISASAFGAAPAIAPGSWIEIYGSGLAVSSRMWTDSDFIGLNAPVSLDGTTVKIGGQAAFIDYVSPGQVNAQVPSNVGTGSQQMTVATAAGTSAAYAVTVNQAQPGLYAPQSFNIGGKQYVVAFFPDGATYVLPPGSIPGVPSRRAKPGDIITLYGIGFGPVTPNIAAGQIVQSSNSLALPLQISFGQARAALQYWGLAPGAIGLYQINLVVPAAAASDAVPLTFTLGGAASQQVLYTAIQN